MRPLRRILLVRPNPWRPRTAASPPLGCLYLASAVRKWLEPGIEIRLADMRAAGMTVQDLRALYREYEPDVAGFSCLSMEHADLMDAVRACKAWNPDCLTVVGGPHASMFGDLLAHEPSIDVLVRGEGEHTFVELLKAWADGRPFGDVPGLIFAQDGELTETPVRPFETDLDELPHPAWDLLDIPAYDRHTNMNGLQAAPRYMSVMTTRGCPYRCIYCHRLFGTRFRQRSVENVASELEELVQRYGVGEIHFVDDNFNLRPERAGEIADQIVARGLPVKIAFPNGIRGDRMTDVLLEKLKAAGTYSITYAVETASKRLQRLIKKNLNLHKVSQAIETTYRLGMIPAAFYMLGFPTETVEEMEATVRFACDSKVLKAYFFTLVPFPRTELYELARKHSPESVLTPEDISSAHSYWAPDPYYSRATGIDLEAIQRRAYRRFYFDPLRVARILGRFPKNAHLLRGVFYGLQASFRLVQELNRRRVFSRT